MGVIWSMVPHTHAGIPFSPSCVIYHWELYSKMKSLHCGTALLLLVLLDIFLRVSGSCWVRDEVAGRFITLKSPTQHGNHFQLHREKDGDGGRHELKIKILERNLWTVYVSHVALCICLILWWLDNSDVENRLGSFERTGNVHWRIPASVKNTMLYDIYAWKCCNEQKIDRIVQNWAFLPRLDDVMIPVIFKFKQIRNFFYVEIKFHLAMLHTFLITHRSKMTAKTFIIWTKCFVFQINPVLLISFH